MKKRITSLVTQIFKVKFDYANDKTETLTLQIFEGIQKVVEMKKNDSFNIYVEKQTKKGLHY
ncbi:hypothetical protein [Streptococcus uberis]|uniref:hypothetical protein n=1 Tax=Streptococcus uberis TaxID=1349 RepID=UPI001EF15FF0|nr:hypothetical protein [Streptococcus uberis]